MQSDPTRRQFLASAATAAASLSCLGAGALRPEIVEVSDPEWRIKGVVEPRAIGTMLERGLMGLTGQGSAAGAWRQIIAPGERVGIKFSKTSRNASGANQALGDAIIAGLTSAGVRRERIIVVEAWGARFPGTGEFDGSYGPEVDTGLGRVRLTRFIREQIDALINVPELKPHPSLGASGARGNLALATTIIDAPWRFHGPRLGDHVAAIYALPALSSKCRLHVLHGLAIGWRQGLALGLDAGAAERFAAARVGGSGHRER